MRSRAGIAGIRNVGLVLLLAASMACRRVGGGLDAGSLPNSELTPGDVLDVGTEALCTTGYSKTVRHVQADVKRHVYAEYGRTPEAGICCEVDHLIPLELGGSNRIENLWPQPYNLKWNARTKDSLENYLHERVCAGELSLQEAQAAIAKNWIDAYNQYYAGVAKKRPARDP